MATKKKEEEAALAAAAVVEGGEAGGSSSSAVEEEGGDEMMIVNEVEDPLPPGVMEKAEGGGSRKRVHGGKEKGEVSYFTLYFASRNG